MVKSWKLSLNSGTSQGCPTTTTSIQHTNESPIHRNQTKNKNKKVSILEGRDKTSCTDDIILYRKPLKSSTQKQLE